MRRVLIDLGNNPILHKYKLSLIRKKAMILTEVFIIQII
ncbi:hypothetical protein BVRB_2g045580 [Beta vulgaris subsp. vulgaris]|uniref:Uncharacterized protein n=1 Tax=Beta vulgaris subsp. vulgaris TaxID=3555 RepID=A0A0J8BHF2_BETVV|nr:hypothetical protein BVRB_2g045580 [Beta vulgaris subsp. vulgaris]